MRQHTNKNLQKELIELYRKALKSGMQVDQIEKKIAHYLKRMEVSENIEKDDDDYRIEETKKKKLPLAIRIGALVVPVVFLSVGVFLVGSAVVPILGAYVNEEDELDTTMLNAPIPFNQVLDSTPLSLDYKEPITSESAKEKAIEIVDTELDYTNLANWFTSGSLPELETEAQNQGISEYILDIPKLDVKNAVVKVGGSDLNKSLIAYEGTALPGEYGAPVIFGHSVLRQFYNPSEKNPRRYTSIFSKIMTLKSGDKIFVTVDGIKYTYIVTNKTEVKPEDVYILTQKYDSKQLKLVTCTPEGTYLRRGVITAQLLEN